MGATPRRPNSKTRLHFRIKSYLQLRCLHGLVSVSEIHGILMAVLHRALGVIAVVVITIHMVILMVRVAAVAIHIRVAVTIVVAGLVAAAAAAVLGNVDDIHDDRLQLVC